jgi:Flp pilus assembly protein TadB
MERDQRSAPPPLPGRLVDARPVLRLGTALWFLAFCVLLVARLGFGVATSVWLWTCLAGWVLGLLGLLIVSWQRAASRRGTRSAQRL